MAKGTVSGERGGVNGNEGALIHTYVKLPSGDEVTVSSSYHDEVAEGNSTFVFEGRDPFYGLIIAGPIREYHTPKHAETLLAVLEAESVEDLRANLPASDEQQVAEARETLEERGELDAMLDELARVLGVPVSAITGEEVND